MTELGTKQCQRPHCTRPATLRAVINHPTGIGRVSICQRCADEQTRRDHARLALGDAMILLATERIAPDGAGSEGGDSMGYPMNYSRVVRRNKLTREYWPNPDDDPYVRGRPMAAWQGLALLAAWERAHDEALALAKALQAGRYTSILTTLERTVAQAEDTELEAARAYLVATRAARKAHAARVWTETGHEGMRRGDEPD